MLVCLSSLLGISFIDFQIVCPTHAFAFYSEENRVHVQLLVHFILFLHIDVKESQNKSENLMVSFSFCAEEKS